MKISKKSLGPGIDVRIWFKQKSLWPGIKPETTELSCISTGPFQCLWKCNKQNILNSIRLEFGLSNENK
jgi:hypothetical protein